MDKAKPHWRHARVRRRIGADATFAKAMARSEFGRFYTDDNEQREVRRSLADAQARRKAACAAQASAQTNGEAKPSVPEKPGKKKQLPWRKPSVRERRTELAEALARLREARRERS